MSTEADPRQDDTGRPENDSEQTPLIEDAYEPEEMPKEVPEEDAPELLSGLSRTLEDDPQDTEVIDAATIEGSKSAAAKVVDRDDDSDAGTITDEPTGTQQVPTEVDWATEPSAHRVVVELKRIETEVRTLLEGVDNKRKRKLSGSRRWRELEEDLLSWQYTSRIDSSALKSLQELIARRDYLFCRLTFLSRTRPVWNT